MKNILTNISIHSSTLLFFLISFLCGLFFQTFIFFLIIFIHEIGHALVANYYKWDIKQICFYPFGGLLKLDNELNKPIKEEFHILFGAYLFQIMLQLFILLLMLVNLLSIETYHYISNINISIMLFNLIPIMPLDGSKILNLFILMKFPFLKSYNINIFISLILSTILLISLFFLPFSASIFLFLCHLIYKTYEHHKNKKYIFNRFILERYLTEYHFNKRKTIKPDIRLFYRDYSHTINHKGTYISEKCFLTKLFSGKRS